ncbi:MAG: TetR/AcrR family transcriptional regulator C-terminal domain-containing protein [Ornithinimicrobium sp.]
MPEAPSLDSARSTLTRERVLRGGVEVADSGGVSRLTMRGLATTLGYEVMSLYNHVASKADLLAGMVDLVVTDIDLPDVEGTGAAGGHEQWQQALRRSCLSAHDCLLEHPWVSPLWSSTPIGPARLQLMESWLGTLQISDLGPEVPHQGFHALSNHVVGFALQNAEVTQSTLPGPEREDFADRARAFLSALDQQTYPRMAEHVARHVEHGEVDASFTFVLDLILDGLVARHPA